MNKIVVQKQENKTVITLNNPPVNAESIDLLNELLRAVKNLKNSVIIIKGNQVLKSGRKIFSAGGDLNEIKQGKTFELASLINKIAFFVRKNNNFVVTFICGDAVGGGWGMPFDISNKIYFLSQSKFIAGFSKNGITPGCGIRELIFLTSPQKAYELVKYDMTIDFSKLKDDKFLIELKNESEFENLIPNILFENFPMNFSKKFEAFKKVSANDLLANLINEIIKNPDDFIKIQLKYLKLSLDKGV